MTQHNQNPLEKVLSDGKSDWRLQAEDESRRGLQRSAASVSAQ